MIESILYTPLSGNSGFNTTLAFYHLQLTSHQHSLQPATVVFDRLIALFDLEYSFELHPLIRSLFWLTPLILSPNLSQIRHHLYPSAPPSGGAATSSQIYLSRGVAGPQSAPVSPVLGPWVLEVATLYESPTEHTLSLPVRQPIGRLVFQSIAPLDGQETGSSPRQILTMCDSSTTNRAIDSSNDRTDINLPSRRSDVLRSVFISHPRNSHLDRITLQSARRRITHAEHVEEPPFRYDERDRACPFTGCFHHSSAAVHSVPLQPKRTR